MHIKLYDVNALCERKNTTGKVNFQGSSTPRNPKFPPSGPTMVGPQVDVAGARNVILPRGAKNTATPLPFVPFFFKKLDLFGPFRDFFLQGQ